MQRDELRDYTEQRVREDSERAEIIQLGMDAKSFFETNIGSYLLACAARDAERATDELKNVDAEDAKTIRDLQSDIRRLDEMKQWLSEAITAGNAEYEQYCRDQRCAMRGIDNDN